MLVSKEVQQEICIRIFLKHIFSSNNILRSLNNSGATENSLFGSSCTKHALMHLIDEHSEKYHPSIRHYTGKRMQQIGDTFLQQ